MSPVSPAVHGLLETLAYLIGGALYWRLRDRSSMPAESWRQLTIIAGALCGAAVGSRVLYMLDYLQDLRHQPLLSWLSGKTIVGALLGGLLGVEFAKKVVAWSRSTGDSFVWPLLIAIAIGRVGCQLSGTEDLTYGTPTSLPWAWNYGDGIGRHPTAAYEILGLGLLALICSAPRLRRVPGDRFRAFMLGYLSLRLALDFLKPPHGEAAVGVLTPTAYGPLSAIQWACLCGMLYYLPALRGWLARATGRLESVG